MCKTKKNNHPHFNLFQVSKLSKEEQQKIKGGEDGEIIIVEDEIIS